MKDVKGKAAFITGGASGVGFGMARVFSDAGMNVVIADIRQDHLDQAMAHFIETGRNAHPILLDVTDREAFDCAADEAEEAFGKIHIVCNNAGVNLFASMDECTYEDWDWVLGVNLGGVINGVRIFVPRIKKHGEGGHIVNTASMASFITGPGAGVYTTSKFAVRGLSEALRWSLAPHRIGVSVLCPGLVKTAIFESDKTRPRRLSSDIGPVDQEFMARLPEIHQVGMEPEEVGQKVLRGIQRNDPYIFTHPEFKDELKAIFDEVLAALPEGEADPRRLAFEESRRQAIAKAKARRPIL
ncbi:MAG TPA: SDR family NAD(P)-dependent oxidoreductase [Blastocatellia bacterium]|nr:SDR family NAD(P)-dependent oxidoreductase [Blastocatellia bacterium]